MKTTAIHCMEMTAKQEHYDFKTGYATNIEDSYVENQL